MSSTAQTAETPWYERRSPTNMPEAVYRCDKLGRGDRPKNQVFVSGHLTVREAMDEADRLARDDRAHTYLVGAA